MTPTDSLSSKDGAFVNENTGRRRRESPAFLHDQNAHSDQKILKLRARGGWAWYGLYWACIETMRSSSVLRIDSDSIEALAYGFRVEFEELNTFLESCLEFKLFAKDKTGIYSPALIARLSNYDAVIEQKRSAGRASAEKRAAHSVNARSTDVQHPFNTRSTPVEQTSNGVEGPLQHKITGVQHPQVNIIQSNTIQSNTIEPNTTDPDDFEALAESALTPAHDPKVLSNNQFVSAGRRPMIKYPDLWLSVGELRQVFETFDRSGIPRSEFRRGFVACASRIATYKAAGKPTTSVSAFAWLTGFLLQEVLDGLKKAVQLETSETYLKQAGAQK